MEIMLTMAHGCWSIDHSLVHDTPLPLPPLIDLIHQNSGNCNHHPFGRSCGHASVTYEDILSKELSQRRTVIESFGDMCSSMKWMKHKVYSFLENRLVNFDSPAQFSSYTARSSSLVIVGYHVHVQCTNECACNKTVNSFWDRT